MKMRIAVLAAVVSVLASALPSAARAAVMPATPQPNVLELDIARVSVHPAGYHGPRRNVIRVVLAERGSTRAEDLFQAAHYGPDGALIDSLGSFRRGDLAGLNPLWRNGQSMASLLMLVSPAGTGYDIGYYGARGLLASIGAFYSAALVTSTHVAARTGTPSRLVQGAADATNPSWATGRATLEHLLKTALFERGLVTQERDELVIVGTDADGASDVAQKFADLIHDIMG